MEQEPALVSVVASARTRVILTGAAGFLGSHALRHLMTNTDWEVVCPVSFWHKGTPERLVVQTQDHPEWWSRIKVVKCDLSSPIPSGYLGNADYIINYASESHVDRSITEPAPFIRNNVDVILNLLAYAMERPVKAFVQVSTDEVYGPAPNDYAHREWDVYLPSNPYSASKAAQESIAFSYWRTYGVPVIITNCMNLIGELQDEEKYLPMLIKKIYQGEVVDIHASREGVIGSRFYLHARNLADAILFLLRRDQASAYGNTDRPDKWHIVGEREVNNLELAQMVAKILGKPLHYQLVDFHSSRPGHDLRYALDGAKLADAGWRMPIPLDQSIEDTVWWTVNHGGL